MSAVVPTRIVLVDDHPAVLAGLSATVARHSDFVVCGTARSADATRRLIRETRAEIAVIDPFIADGEGLPWIAKLMGEFSKLRVIVYTLQAEEHLLRNALEMRTSGYVLKSSELTTMIDAICSARAGSIFIDPVLTSRNSGRQHNGRTEPARPAAAVSRRELETLRLTALGYGIKEIADELGVSTKSVETFKLRGSGKLGLKSRSAIVRYAIANGWFSEPVDDDHRRPAQPAVPMRRQPSDRPEP